MASDSGEGSSMLPPAAEKPVIVRVKRKTIQSPLEGFWLEINERPLKKALLDFAKLSVSESSTSEGLKTKKVFVQHVETSTNSEATIDIVQSFLFNSADVLEDKRKHEERRLTFKKDNRQARQDERLSKAIENQETSAKNARFEQIWRSRKGDSKEMPDEAVHEKFNFYDVLRVDGEEGLTAMDMEHRELSLEDQRVLSSYLPLLEEFIPAAAAELEYDIRSYMAEQDADEYVYDYYTVDDDMKMDSEDASSPFPLVQVDDVDFYDEPVESEYDSQDSNAEDNPLNDYPDEISEDESETTEGSEEDETESASEKSSEHDLPDTVFTDDELYYGNGVNGDDMASHDDGYSDDDGSELEDCR